jgi:Family of unknown function (DUF6083)
MSNAIDMGRPSTLDGDPCRYCGAEIAFARTPARALMPLDVEPARAIDVPVGSHFWYDEAETTVRRAVDRDWVYVPHFGTCPKTQEKPPTNPELRRRWERNGGR